MAPQINDPIGITSVAFSVSGRLLFAGYDDFECKVSPPASIYEPSAAAENCDPPVSNDAADAVKSTGLGRLAGR